MSSPFPTHRAAQEFARVVDGPSRTDVADRYADLVRTVTLLREHPTPVPRREFVADLRERLMTAADTELVPARRGRHAAPGTTRSPRRRERHLGAVAAALVVVGGTAGVAVAAQGSLPGDSLYPVKRGIENVQAHITRGDAAQGRAVLGQASDRLGEVRALLDGPQGSQTPKLVASTLRSFSQSAGQGARLLFTAYQAGGEDRDIATVRGFTSGRMSALTELERSAPASARPSLEHAAGVLAELDQQARVLCVACSVRAPVTPPSSLRDVSSTPALHTLVTVPTAEVKQVAALARAAQREARHAQHTAQHTPLTDPAGIPSLGEVGQQVTDQVHQQVRPSSHPVRDLLTGITSQQPPVTGPVTKTLKDATKGVTKGLTDGVGTGIDSGTKNGPVSGLTDGLGTTLNDSLGGLLGGSGN